VPTGDTAAEVRPAQVRGKDVIPLGRIDIEERACLGACGVVDPDVESVPAAEGSAEAFLDGVEVFFAEVAALDRGRAAP